MGRTNTSGQEPNPRGGRPQPYARLDDLQKEGEPASARAEYENPLLDKLLGGDLKYEHEPKGKTSFIAGISIGGGEITPMKVAAVVTGTNIFFIAGAIALVIKDHPGWAFGVFVLIFLQVAGVITLALYESATRRAAGADVQTTSAEIPLIVPARPTDIEEIDMNTKNRRSAPADENATPRALDGGEPVQ